MLRRGRRQLRAMRQRAQPQHRPRRSPASLPQNFVDRADGWEFVGSSVSDANGDFQMFDDIPSERSAPIVQADRGPVTLASAIGYGQDPPLGSSSTSDTVAIGNAFRSSSRAGARSAILRHHQTRYAWPATLPIPAPAMSGASGSRTPNGGETSTFVMFNLLANAVAAGVAKDSACLDLFNAGRPPGGAAPDNVLQAVATFFKYLAYPGYPRHQQIPYSSCPCSAGAPASPSDARSAGSCPPIFTAASTARRTEQSHERPR